MNEKIIKTISAALVAHDISSLAIKGANLVRFGSLFGAWRIDYCENGDIRFVAKGLDLLVSDASCDIWNCVGLAAPYFRG